MRTEEPITISQCMEHLSHCPETMSCARCRRTSVAPNRIERSVHARREHTYRDVKLRFVGYSCMQIIPVARSECCVAHKRSGLVRMLPHPFLTALVFTSHLYPPRCVLVPVPSRRPERASCERLSRLEKPMLLSARDRTRELCLESGAGCADCCVTSSLSYLSGKNDKHVQP